MAPREHEPKTTTRRIERSQRAIRRAIAARRIRTGLVRRGREGMTLVEIMIVVIIMAMIVTAVGVAVLPRLNESRIQQARTDAQSVRGAVEMYLAQNPGSGCPSVSDLVDARILNARTRTADPWNNDFDIECNGDDVVVVSAGPDGQMGTADDVQ